MARDRQKAPLFCPKMHEEHNCQPRAEDPEGQNKNRQEVNDDGTDNQQRVGDRRVVLQIEIQRSRGVGWAARARIKAAQNRLQLFRCIDSMCGKTKEENNERKASANGHRSLLSPLLTRHGS